MQLTTLLASSPAFATAAAATPLVSRAFGPTVKITNGTIIGSTSRGIDTFEGIPYAQPPLNELRLKPPQVLHSGLGSFLATSIPKSCPQLQASTGGGSLGALFGMLANTPFGQALTASSEDCLTINVQRPSTASSSPALPVLVYFFGGGFATGASSLYDGSPIVQSSMNSNQPIVYVAMNYRLGGLGFLAGDELSRDGSTNLGLRDQRLALEWVQDNIAAFGGDPSKVTIFGESAGAISVLDHTVINGGDNTYKGRPLFRAAIMNSGSIVPAEDVSSAKPQATYDSIVRAAGCNTAPDSLVCLRSLSTERFLDAANSVPASLSYQSLNMPYLPRPDPRDNFFSHSPETSYANNAYAKIPLIIGDQEDEGTLFAMVQKNMTTTADLTTYFTTWWPSAPQSFISGLVATYPDNPAAGSPFDTGLLFNTYPQRKRLAAIMGDVSFTLIRRKFLSLVAAETRAWSFLATFGRGASALGTFHGSDVAALFYGNGVGRAGARAQETFLTHYVNFVNALDPNVGLAGAGAGATEWPQWTVGQPQLLNIGSTNDTLLADEFRSQSYAYIEDKLSMIRI